MTWGGFTKVPEATLPYEPDNGGQWSAARGHYNSPHFAWNANQNNIVMWYGAVTSTTNNQYRLYISAAKYNSSTGKLDYATAYQVDADSYIAAGYPIQCVSASESASDDRWLVYRKASSGGAMSFNVVKLATFSAGQSVYDSIGSWVTPHNSGIYPLAALNAPSIGRVAIGFWHSASVPQWKLYTRSGNSLSLTGNQGIMQGPTGSFHSSVIRLRDTSTRADFLSAVRHGSYYSSYYTTAYPFQITNAAHTSSSTFAMACQTSQDYVLSAGAGGTHHNSYIGAGWQPEYVKTNGSLTETTGNLFNTHQSQIINVASGDSLYHAGQWGWEDANLTIKLQKHLITYATTSNSGNTSNNDLITQVDSDVWNRPENRREKFMIYYGTDFYVINHWNQDRNMLVMMDNRYGAAVYKDNDNGQYTANSLKAYADSGVHYQVLNAGNANIETTPDFGVDRIYLGIAQATVTGNGSNQVTINIVGNTDSNQSGLVVGAKYYMNEKGNLVPNKPYHGPVDLEVGTAISASTLVLANNQNTSGMSTSSSTSDLLLDG